MGIIGQMLPKFAISRVWGYNFEQSKINWGGGGGGQSTLSTFSTLCFGDFSKFWSKCRKNKEANSADSMGHTS